MDNFDIRYGFVYGEKGETELMFVTESLSAIGNV